MISIGVSRTAMPAFAGRLTEEERWHLVNYISTFQAVR
jgi:mono/diheme cytochrome c family protein